MYNSKTIKIMVTVTEFNQRKSDDGREFFTLTIQGGVEIVKSVNGNSYITARTTSIPTTFNEMTCSSLIGKELPGQVVKVECESYEYLNKETGEMITLSHTYEYLEAEKQVVEQALRSEFTPFSLNGKSIMAQA
ncbi:hypothetical protein PI23P_04617 [Polaribacter irgensii 23-P]|uniref:Uncharacterized protein n=1 Tax=Polaribacter irgensii 23-P TaxID=313594 RepID=A4BXR0_9FLAO|nr:hypothetical protein [Polaribacter irgensii]EAR13751.1 hypothetical protein PI23P_04617 [Polaribacter irgensii 23-P]